jgi:hypothetical protein
MSEIKYQYLYNKDNLLIHHSKAIRGEDYRIRIDFPLDYTYKQGEERAYFVSKINTNNPFFDVGNKGGFGGESIEHHNAKMEIVFNKKYFDTVFEKWIEFDEVLPEVRHDNKQPDLSCYIDKKLVCCIEIFNTNAKTENDILELKKIGVPIIEIDINNENRCKHIVLPTLLEANREKYEELSREYKSAKTEEQRDLSERIFHAVEIETQFDDNPTREMRELEEEYFRLADELQSGLSGITREIEIIESGTESFKRRNKDKLTERIKRVNQWLQARIQRFGIEEGAGNKIKTTEREIKKIEADREKRDYRSGKFESEIDSIKGTIKERRNAFNEIAKQSKIEWFRSSWMNYKSQNVIEEIKYWLS